MPHPLAWFSATNTPEMPYPSDTKCQKETFSPKKPRPSATDHIWPNATALPPEHRENATRITREYHRNVTGLPREYHQTPENATKMPVNATKMPVPSGRYNNAPCPGLTARNPCAFNTTTRNSGGKLLGVTFNRA